MIKHFLLICAAATLACTQGLFAQLDVTNTYLRNPSFDADGVLSENTPMTAWTVTKSNSGYASFRPIADTRTPNNSYPIGDGITAAGAVDGSCYLYLRDNWGTAGHVVSQTTVQPLPVGHYTLACHVQIPVTDNGGTWAYNLPEVALKVIANGTEIQAVAQYGYTYWKPLTVEFDVTSEAKVEVQITMTGNSSNDRGGILACVDNVRLYAYTYDALQDAIAQAETYYQQDGKAAADFRKAIDAAKAITAQQTPAEIADALVALLAATENYRVAQWENVSTSYTSSIQNAGMETSTGGTLWNGKAGQNVTSYLNYPEGFTAAYLINGQFNFQKVASNVAEGSYAHEAWASAENYTHFEMYQDVESLPAGKWLFTGKVRSNTDGEKQHLFVQVGDYTEALFSDDIDGTNLGTGSGNWQMLSVPFVKFKASDKVRIGIEANAFVQWDDFQLTMTAQPDIAYYKQELQLLADSAALWVGRDIDEAAKTALSEALETANGILADSAADYADIENGIAVLQQAFENAMPAITLYLRMQTWTANLPYEITNLIVNPGFEESDRFSGWENNGMQGQTNTSFAKVGTAYVEKWTNSNTTLSNCSVSQTLAGLPNGVYVLTAKAQAIQQGNGTYPGGAYVFAGNMQTEVFAANDYRVVVEVTDNTLTFGFRTEGTGANWVAVDNFRLSFCGDWNGNCCSNADLTTLTTDVGKWNRGFDPAVTEYDIVVNLLDEVTVSATSSNFAGISGTGTVTLVSGQTTVHNVVVTSLNGQQKTYQLRITSDPASVLSSSLGDWMGKLRCDTRISKLTVPGTHDSGTSNGGSISKCQDKTIAEQLAMGIRFLDIRLRASSGKLEVCHGTDGMGIYFEEAVMTPCKEFLAAHPGETIFMALKQDDGEEADYLTLLQSSLESDANKPYLVQSLAPAMTLDEVRGKIICLHRNKPDWDYYGGYYSGFADNTTFESTIQVKYGSNITYKAEDYYSIGSLSPDYDAKESAITALLAESKSSADTDNRWFLTYLSASLSSIGALTNTPEKIAKEIGPRVMNWLNSQGIGTYGFVLMDFAGSDAASGPALTEFLIDCNTAYIKTDTLYYYGTTTVNTVYDRNGFYVLPTAAGVFTYYETRKDAAGCEYVAALELTVEKPAVGTDVSAEKESAVSVQVRDGMLEVCNSGESCMLQVYDICGRAVLSRNIPAGDYVYALPHGTFYVVKAGSHVFKVIVY